MNAKVMFYGALIGGTTVSKIRAGRHHRRAVLVAYNTVGTGIAEQPSVPDSPAPVAPTEPTPGPSSDDWAEVMSEVIDQVNKRGRSVTNQAIIDLPTASLVEAMDFDEEFASWLAQDWKWRNPINKRYSVYVYDGAVMPRRVEPDDISIDDDAVVWFNGNPVGIEVSSNLRLTAIRRITMIKRLARQHIPADTAPTPLAVKPPADSGAA